MTKNEPDQAAREPSTGGKRLVLVVHGLGDSTPGETVRPLARAIATASGRSRVPADQVLWLSEGSGRQIENFPCHVERIASGDEETVLAEVCWADLSRLGRQIPDLLLGVFRVVFGLHHVVARHATDTAGLRGSGREPAAGALQRLSLVIGYLLRGPAPAATLLWAVGLAFNIVALKVGGAAVRENQRVWVAVLSVAVNLVALAVGTWGLRRWRGRLHRTLFLWLAIFASMNLLIWLVVSAQYSLAEMMPLTTEQTALGDSTVFAYRLVVWPSSISLLLVALAVPLWGVARLRAGPARRPGIDATQGFNVVVQGAFVVLMQFLLVVLSGKLPEDAIPKEVKALLAGMATIMAYNWIYGLIPAVALLVTLVLRARWAKRTRARSYQASRPAPRLILGRGFLFSLISIPIVMLLLPYVLPGLAQWLFDTLSGASPLVILVAALFAGVATYTSEGVHFALDFGLDFVSHFERQQSEPDGKLTFVRRERIRDRLRIVLETLIRQEAPDRVTILAHSQGTVVAVETLAEDRAAALLDPLARCDLVTMGSPFHHIYQHYFPNDYPPLSHKRWDGLRQRIDRWINIFRIDDPVGSDIEPGSAWPENSPVDPGGHTNYWSDRQVLQILHDRQLV